MKLLAAITLTTLAILPLSSESIESGRPSLTGRRAGKASRTTEAKMTCAEKLSTTGQAIFPEEGVEEAIELARSLLPSALPIKNDTHSLINAKGENVSLYAGESVARPTARVITGLLTEAGMSRVTIKTRDGLVQLDRNLIMEVYVQGRNYRASANDRAGEFGVQKYSGEDVLRAVARLSEIAKTGLEVDLETEFKISLKNLIGKRVSIHRTLQQTDPSPTEIITGVVSAVGEKQISINIGRQIIRVNVSNVLELYYSP